MRGRRPSQYQLEEEDRDRLQDVADDDQVVPRISNRAQALLALDRGERIAAITRQTGLTRMGLWYLWRRYTQRGVEAIFDSQRSGRPPLVPDSESGQDRRPPGDELAAFDFE